MYERAKFTSNRMIIFDLGEKSFFDSFTISLSLVVPYIDSIFTTQKFYWFKTSKPEHQERIPSKTTKIIQI